MSDAYSQFTYKFVNGSYIDRKYMVERLCSNLKEHYIYDYVSRCNTYSINSEPYNIYEVIERLRALNNSDVIRAVTDSV
jgi:hypothetical protein